MIPHPRPAAAGLLPLVGGVCLAAASLPLMAEAIDPAAVPPPAPVTQSTGPRGETVYQAAFFVPFSAANALQMVQRTPGFTLERIDSSVRGFAAAAGNVVINGQRPSAKSDPLETILARIPANRVLRVEVGPGDLYGAEYSGKPQVLNLVLRAEGGLAGTAEGTLRRAYTGELYPDLSLSALLTRGKSTVTVALKLDSSAATTEEGYDRITEAASARLVEYRRKVNTIREPVTSASAAWAHDDGANRTAHLNTRVALDRVRLGQTNDVTPLVGPVRDDRLTQHYDISSFELGGDITRPLAGGGLKLVGLATRRHRDNLDTQFNRVGGQVLGGGEQSLVDSLDETIGRLVWTRADLGGWSVEAGAERAFNRLRSAVDVYALDGAGGRSRIDLPIDNAVVEETRTEAFVNAGHRLSSRLRTDLGVTVESSHLVVSGDVAADRRLRFIKPKAVLDWRAGKAWHAQVSLQRRVAQLQFQDFISNAELTTNRVNGGNADLLPQRSWDLLGFVEHPLLGDGLVRVEAGYNAVELVQDRVPTPEGFDAPGNLGNGRELILRGKLDMPLARLGLRGGRLSLSTSYLSTRVRDPYTGLDRPYSGTSAFVWQAAFRQDRGKFAWGFELSGNTPSTFYRRDELDRTWSQMPYVTAFADYRPDARTTLTLGLDNATGVPAFRRRQFFTPDRRTATADLEEYRQRNRHVVPYVSLKRTI
ncbi:MAG: hypothetical protein KGL54_01345 [Sphingomonadales bacterium]|nr:hypothetical protein [Sphingomonadales bacterium]